MSASAVIRASVADLFRDPRRPREGNTILLGVAAILLLTVVFLASIGTPQLWYLARTQTYAVEFANAGGIREGDPVLVAGVATGRVDDIELRGGVAVVHLRVDRGQPLGDATTATIGLKSVLGNRFVQLDPAGSTALAAGATIPVARTTSPYTLDDLGENLTELATEADQEQATAAISALNRTLPQDPHATGEAIDATGQALDVLAGDADRMDGLVDSVRAVTDTLSAQESTIDSLTSQSQTVVTVLQQRRDNLSTLVRVLQHLSTQLADLVDDESEDISQLIANIDSVAQTYERNVDAIDQTMTRMPPGMRNVADATGNGPWTDVTAPSGPIPDAALCLAGVLTGCR